MEFFLIRDRFLNVCLLLFRFVHLNTSVSHMQLIYYLSSTLSSMITIWYAALPPPQYHSVYCVNNVCDEAGRYCCNLWIPLLRIRAPSAGQVLPNPTLSTTGKYFLAGRPVAAELRRTRDAQSQCRCMRIPSYMLAQFSLGHTLPTSPGQWLVFYDHFFVGFLCARVRLVHHHLHPLLHPQMGRM